MKFMAIEDLNELHKKFQEVCARFTKKYNEYQSAAPEYEKGKLKQEARQLCQESLTVALQLGSGYRTLIKNLEEMVANGGGSATEKQIEEYRKKLAEYEGNRNHLEKLLLKLDSPMKGIPETTFDDIAGLNDVKETIKNYVFLLKNGDIAEKYGISTNLGILLYGPPGTGKTLIAEAIAHELGVRYFVITPSQIFGSYVGESEKNIRDVFSELRACTDGSVLLVDECESIFARRENSTNRAAIGVANQLLQEMNGQGDKNSKRVIIGATNRPELLDEAYLRFKRFSMQFYVGMPDAEAVRRVVELNFKKHPVYEPMAKDYLISELLGDKYKDCFTCADISGIIERCAYLALQKYRHGIESGVNSGLVKISADNVKQVLADYPRSVTAEMLLQYQIFKDAHVQH